mmetsp:Transcript_17752/g.31067  ORF Transcript_17752/g.31067 Transcript_17752/m.31067 type:complete len:664 (+) Transcript_17752:3-1994(+)
MSIRRSEVAVKSAALNHVAMGVTCSAVGFIGSEYAQRHGDDQLEVWNLRSPSDFKTASLAAFSPSLPAVHNVFVFSISQNDEFASLVRDIGLGRYKGGAEILISERIMPLCFACYSETEKLVLGAENSESTALSGARAEIEALNLKITSCNLNAMKQIEALHKGGAVELQDEQHQFYEPLRYMNDDTRELVLLTMVQKLRQLDMDTAPNSLVQQLIQLVRSLGGYGDVDRSKSEEEAGDDTKADRNAALEAERNKSALLKSKLEAAEARLKELRDQAQQTEEELAKTKKELRDQEMQCEAFRQEVLKSKESLAEKDRKIGELSQELVTMRLQLKNLQEQASNAALLESQLQAAREEAERRAREGREAAQRMDEMQAKIHELEKELAKHRNSGRSKPAEVQTDLGGEELQNMLDENTRLKVALEEMKAKLNDLVQECSKKGLDMKIVEKSMEKVGLDMYRCRNIFARLYKDAVDRIDRMDKLRERYRVEKERRHAPDNILPEESLAAEVRQKLTIAQVEAAMQSPEHRRHVNELLQGPAMRRGSVGPLEWQQAGRPYQERQKAAEAASPLLAGGRRWLIASGDVPGNRYAPQEDDPDLYFEEKEGIATKKRGSVAGWPGGRSRDYAKQGNTQSLPSLHVHNAAATAAAGTNNWGRGRRRRHADM